MNASLLCQWFQVPFQVVTHAECGSNRVWEQKRARILAVWMPGNPRCDLSREIRGHRDVAVALRCLCSADSIPPSFTLLQGLVDPELWAFEILNPQHENLSWPQPADGENPHYQMLTWWCLG